MGFHFPLYGFVALLYISIKLLVSVTYTPPRGNATPVVSVIIPEYNEDPALFERSLDSILSIEYPIEEVLVVDDGSNDTQAWDVAQRYAADYDVIQAFRYEDNRGKREAQAYAFERAIGEVFVTVDSDTVVASDSIDQLVKSFSDSEVMAVTGYPKIINRENGFLTRLIDMRYYIAFNVERAAQSVNGTVVCCCGVLSAYRGDFVRDVMDEYTAQTFLGQQCTFGDDRRLTAHALQQGKVLYQSLAVSQTAAPETLRGYIKQQVRWMRSFWRESILALSWSYKRSWLMTANIVVDLLLPFALVFIGFRTALLHSLIYGPLIFAGYVFVISGIGYLRNLNYARENTTMFLLSPIYSIFYLVALLPLSFYALATIRTMEWGTR